MALGNQSVAQEPPQPGTCHHLPYRQEMVRAPSVLLHFNGLQLGGEKEGTGLCRLGFNPFLSLPSGGQNWGSHAEGWPDTGALVLKITLKLPGCSLVGHLSPCSGTTSQLFLLAWTLQHIAGDHAQPLSTPEGQDTPCPGRKPLTQTSWGSVSFPHPQGPSLRGPPTRKGALESPPQARGGQD